MLDVDRLWQRVPRRLRKIARAAELTARGVAVLHRSGLLGALRPRGVASFVGSLRGAHTGPQQIIRLHAFNTPDRVAIVSHGNRLTYRELDERICRLAHALHGLGVGPGTPVGVMMRNCHEYLETQFAVAHLGATIVQVGYRLKPSEVAYILANSESKAFLFGQDFAETAREALGKIAALSPGAAIVVGESDGFAPYEGLIDTAGPVHDPPAVSAGSFGALMIYTSGTTGKPKGALRDFRKTGLEPIFSMMSELPLSHNDRHLVCCPLYHGAAPAFTTLTFFVGGTIVIPDAFEPEETLRTIEFERITSSMMVPTMLSRIVNLPSEVLRRYDTSSLRWLISGAAPLPTTLAAKVESLFGPLLYNFYGATETGLVTLALPGEHTARPGTIGRALAGNEIHLLDDEGNEVATGEVGELWVKSAMTVKGYYRNDDASSQAQRRGLFSVGDMARRDADGHYYLADRKIDMVISGGVNIYPLEIEQRLHAHPAILDCAVLGVPDDEWGEALCAFLVVRPGHSITPAQARDFIAEQLADFKKPKHVLFTDALPRTPTGKVLKRELRERARAQLTLAVAHA